VLTHCVAVVNYDLFYQKASNFLNMLRVVVYTSGS